MATNFFRIKNGTNIAVGGTPTELGDIAVTGTRPQFHDGTSAKDLNPVNLTSTGDLIYASAANTPARLAVGAANQVLQSVGGIPVWSTVNLSGINYISSNPSAETDTSGWATYANSAANIPSTGTGGSPNTTFTRTTSSTLRGAGSFLWTKSSGASRQGEGVGYAFTIDNADLAKPLAITFDYKNVSGTFTASNGSTAPLNDGTTSTNAGNSTLEVFVYDVTNAVLIPVSPQVLVSNSTLPSTFKGVFQTASNSTSYRLIIHTALAENASMTMQFDNFFVGPQAVSYGPAMTDWVAYTPTFTGFGTATNVSFQSRRVGDSLEVHGVFNAGTVTATEARVTLGYNGTSANITIDSNKIQTGALIGSAVCSNSASTFFGVYPLANGANTYFNFGYQASATAATAVANASSFLNNNQLIYVALMVPISGWSSTTLMSNDTDTRVVSAYTNGSSTSFGSGAGATLVPTTVSQDTHSGFSSGIYTVPVSGTYVFGGTLQTSTATTFIQLYYKKNNGTSILISSTLSSSQTFNATSGTATLQLSAGDNIRFVGVANTSVTADSQCNTFIYRISGPATIAATESVNASYNSTAATVYSSGNTYILGTKNYDSHSAYNSSTGVYTVPVSGKYRVVGSLQSTTFTPSAGNFYGIDVYKNGSKDKRISLYTANAAISQNVYQNGTTTLSCVAGDTISLVMNISSGTLTSQSLDGTGDNYILIERIGN